MAATAHNAFDAERFAALWAGADTGNNNEAEAITKFRAARRMAAGGNLRLVDCMTGRDDVMKALDAQMKPLRKNGASAADLAAARERADKLGSENLDLMRQVREVAGLLKQEKEISQTWARKFEQERQRAAQAQNEAGHRVPAAPAATPAPVPAAATSASVDGGGCVAGFFYGLVSVVLMVWGCIAAWHWVLATVHHSLHWLH